MLSATTSRLLGLFHHLSGAYFGNQLCKSKIVAITKDKVLFSCLVKKEVTKNGILTSSAAFAIFDELSTVGLIALDKQHRPGVSVSLSTTLTPSETIKIGEEMTLEVQYEKIGKTIAFTSMIMRNEKKSIIARGNHIKYLPLGWFFDNIISIPFIFDNLTKALYNIDENVPTWLGNKMLESSEYKPLSSKSSNKNENDSDSHQSQSVFDDLDMTNSEFKIKRMHCNPFNMAHGGALGMAIEEAAIQSVAKGREMLSVEVNYLNSIPLGSTATIIFQQTENYEDANTYKGNILCNGKITNSFTLSFR